MRGTGLFSAPTVPVRHGGGHINIPKKMLRPGTKTLEKVKNACHPLTLKRKRPETEPPRALWDKKKKASYHYHQVFNKVPLVYDKPMSEGQCHLPATMFACKESVTKNLKDLVIDADLKILREEVQQKDYRLIRARCPDIVSFFRNTSGTFIARVKLRYPHDTWHWIGFDAWRGIVCTGLHDEEVLQQVGLGDLESHQSVIKFLRAINIQSIHFKAQFWKQGKKV
jgi:hypothetical protein